MSLTTSIVEAAEPFVEWNNTIGVVTIEQFVVQVMGVGASFMQVLCADFDFVKAAVSLSGRQGRMGEIEKHDDWMTWNNPMNRNATEIEKMFNRMHAEP